ncbi:MAG: transcriptional regulator, TetR family [Mucilaginibacter sp.]|nr:transcriptional regulator, TetR family [Mucilaginibacter sp.]
MSASNPIKEDVIQEQILQAAKQLFQIHGLRKVTMDDVARVIGKGRSSLYYYYKSKEEILDAVMDVEIREMLTAMALAVDKALTAEQKIHAFCVTKLKILREKNAFYNTLDAGMDADEMSNFNKTKIALHRRIMKQESALLSQILNHGVEKGELRMINEKDLNILIFVLLSSVRGLKREMVIENDFSGIEPAVDALTQMVIHGLKK